MNDTTSPKHPPPSHDQEPPGASHAQCGNIIHWLGGCNQANSSNATIRWCTAHRFDSLASEQPQRYCTFCASAAWLALAADAESKT